MLSNGFKCFQASKTKQSASMYTSFASNIQKHFFLPSLSSLSASWSLPAFIFYPSFLPSKLPVTKIKNFQGTKSSCSQTRSLVKPELTQPSLINGLFHHQTPIKHQHVQQRNTFVQCGFGIASTALLGKRNVQNCCAYLRICVHATRMPVDSTH